MGSGVSVRVGRGAVGDDAACVCDGASSSVGLGLTVATGVQAEAHKIRHREKTVIQFFIVHLHLSQILYR